MSLKKELKLMYHNKNKKNNYLFQHQFYRKKQILSILFLHT